MAACQVTVKLPKGKLEGVTTNSPFTAAAKIQGDVAADGLQVTHFLQLFPAALYLSKACEQESAPMPACLDGTEYYQMCCSSTVTRRLSWISSWESPMMQVTAGGAGSVVLSTLDLNRLSIIKNGCAACEPL